MGDGGETHRNSRLVFNIGGQRHETFVNTLKAIPGSRLSWISENFQILKHSPAYDAEKDEFFFDRNPSCFEAILNYFRTGQLHYPANICGTVFEFELKFWGIDEAQMVSCCWEGYTQNRDKDAKLAGFKGPLFNDGDSDDEDDDDYTHGKIHRYRLKLWHFLDDPYSSKAAKIHSYIGYMFLFLYILLPILSSMEVVRNSGETTLDVLKVIEIVLTFYFTVEFTLRFSLGQKKKEFFKDRLNFVDIMSMMPIYLQLLINNTSYSNYTDILAIFRVVKVFRSFRYNYTLQVLINTLKESLPELSLLVFLMLLLATIFAYASYFIEGRLDDTLFKSIPHCLWWSFITMTTVGYGDMAPESWMGKVVGIMCAVCGLLMVALPVSVVATNFSIYYSYAKARISLPPKKKVKIAENANLFLGEKTITEKETKPKKRNKVEPNEKEKNGNIKNGHKSVLNGAARGKRGGKLPPLSSKSRGTGYWIEAFDRLKENGQIKVKKKMDIASLVMVLSSKGEWSAPA